MGTTAQYVYTVEAGFRTNNPAFVHHYAKALGLSVKVELVNDDEDTVSG